MFLWWLGVWPHKNRSTLAYSSWPKLTQAPQSKVGISDLNSRNSRNWICRNLFLKDIFFSLGIDVATYGNTLVERSAERRRCGFNSKTFLNLTKLENYLDNVSIQVPNQAWSPACSKDFTCMSALRGKSDDHDLPTCLGFLSWLGAAV